ncbi:pilus assembly protein PilM [bacterium]|nr:pilus assembly protein PilM [bacterium]MBU1984950.1 pilus assembly protein PilM [bacterium]
MFGLKSNLRVGLDIGSHAIKLVVAEKGSHGKLRLVKAISRDLYAGQDKFDMDGPKKTQVVPLLLEMFQEIGVRPKRISHLGSCIGGTNQAAKEIRTLQLSEDEMASSILQEARKHVPLDGSESVVDYQILGEDPKEADKLRVLVAATTKRMFDAHVDMLREAELKPGVLDLEPLAAANSFLGHVELPDDGVVVFLNIGARRTNLLILGRKDMFFSRDLPVGGYAFTEDIMKKLNVKFAEAEEIKKTRGIQIKEHGAGEEAPSFALADKSPIEKLGDEINRSLRYYVKETGQSFFNHIEMVGGVAESSEVSEYLANKFNIEVRSFDPFLFLEGVQDVRHRPQYAAAVGLVQRAQGS